MLYPVVPKKLCDQLIVSVKGQSNCEPDLLVFWSQDGVVSPEDIDKVMTAGLGPRYSFIGPLETCHLNANGKQCQVVYVPCTLVPLST